MRTTRVIAFVVASVVSSSLAHAQGSPSDSVARHRAMQDRREMRGDREMREMHMRHRGDEEMEGPRGPRGPLRGIRLSDAERDKVRAIHEKYGVQGRALRDSLRPAMQEARDARAKGDSAAARAAWERGKGDRDRIKALHDRAMAEVRGALSAEHQAQFDANVARMDKRRAEWEKGGRGRRGDDGMSHRPGDDR